MVVIWYYAFTTLSTVGFGDLHPKNYMERIIVSVVLLMGVATFSYIMSIFIEILNAFQEMNDDFDDGDKLSKFFGLLKELNRDMEIS